ncbi:hypothetical protein TWF751_007635 [Orbilia oligospora]|nr:hypothetical protein TWF751_007635 [Orbilia oligospora]
MQEREERKEKERESLDGRIRPSIPRRSTSRVRYVAEGFGGRLQLESSEGPLLLCNTSVSNMCAAESRGGCGNIDIPAWTCRILVLIRRIYVPETMSRRWTDPAAWGSSNS